MLVPLISGAIGAAAGVAGLHLKNQRASAIARSKAVDQDRSTTSSAGGGVLAYETSKAVDEYLMFHYGADKDILPYPNGPRNALDFPARCALLCEKYCAAATDFTGEKGPSTALDIGCAVGGSTFALARAFEQVLGLDYSHAFIDAAKSMKEKGSRQYTAVEESHITRTFTASVPRDVDINRVSFGVGDACNLPADLPQFDAVLASNLLCRLPEPAAFLKRMASVVKKDGVLVLVSPHSWLEAWTSKDKWIGGYMKDGVPMMTFDGIKAILEADFELIHQEDVPFLIREHARKFQWGCSHGTVWKRRA